MDNPNFRKWFGDSVTVNPDGTPMVFYHGTRHSFEEFANYNMKTFLSGLGYFFTNSIEESEEYTERKDGANIIPVYLSLCNPYYMTIDNEDKKFYQEMIEDEKENLNNIIQNGTEEEIKNQMTIVSNLEKDFANLNFLEIRTFAKYVDNHGPIYVRDEFMNQGYDGFILDIPDANGDSQGLNYYVVFKPQQIKSIYNNGHYNPNSSKISEASFLI